MQRFLTGVAIVFIALAAWAIGTRPASAARSLEVFAALAGVPVCAAWIAAEGFLRISPRKSFDARVRPSLSHFAAGILTGIGGAVFSTALLGVLDGYELLILGGCSAGFTVVALGRFSRAKCGCCVHCGYDLRGTAGPRCPECGEFNSRFGSLNPDEAGGESPTATAIKELSTVAQSAPASPIRTQPS